MDSFKMSVHVICLTSAGGLPVFTRRKGDCESLPYSTIGSLNGVHMFSKSHNMEMLHTSSQDHNIAWKEFHDSIVLIGISSGSTIQVLQKVLESVFNAMILIVGLDEIKTQRNIERLKRELKVSYPIIDKLLDSIDYGDSSSHSSDLVSMSEGILCSENHQIQLVLDSYAENIDTLYACVLIHGKIAVATDSWWTLHADERKMLSILGSLEHDATAKDYPVFLPHKSPNTAFRLVSCTLIPDVVVCCLLGATPPLEEIEQNACQTFKASMEMLRSAEETHPRNFPASVQLDSGISGFLLVNYELDKYILSKNPQQSSTKRIQSSSHRLDILRTFYYQSVLTFLLAKPDDLVSTNITSSATETYWCSEYHKCHAIKVADNILCVLYASTVPTQAMKLISQKTLKLLITDRQFCW